MSTKELTLDGLYIQNILYDMFSISFIGYFNDRDVDSEVSDSYKDFKFILKYNTFKKYFKLSVNYKDSLIVETVLTRSMLQNASFHIDVIIKCIEEMSDVELYQDKEDIIVSNVVEFSDDDKWDLI